MRVFGIKGNKVDPSRGIKVYGTHGAGDDYDWLTIPEAKIFLKSLQKAIEHAERK